MPLHECFHVPVTSCQRAEVKRVLHCDATTRVDMDALLSETLPAVAIFSPPTITNFLQLKQQRCNIKVDKNRERIYQCRDQRRSHDRRVKMNLLCEQWKHTSDHLSHNDCSDQRECNHQCKGTDSDTGSGSESIHNRKCSSYDQGDTELLEYNLEEIFKMDLIQCNSTDDQGCTLGTTVSAGIHQHEG